MAITFHYCFFTPTLLKWMEMIGCAIIIGLIEKGLKAWDAYPFILFAAAFCLVVTAIFLIVYFSGFHVHMTCWSWGRVESIFNFLACILMFISFGIAVFDTVKMYDGSNRHQDHAGTYGGSSYNDWKHRMAAISFFTGFNGVLYIFSGAWVNHRGIIVIT